MTEATASKETVERPKRQRVGNLRLVDHDQTAEQSLIDASPPVAVMVPAIDPLSEYRADAHRRQMDAQGEIELRESQDRRAEAGLAARLEAAFAECTEQLSAAQAKYDRFVTFETQKRDAERREIEGQIAQFREIVDGTERSLQSTDAIAAVRLPAPSDD